jgi:hypothetical protein
MKEVGHMRALMEEVGRPIKTKCLALLMHLGFSAMLGPPETVSLPLPLTSQPHSGGLLPLEPLCLVFQFLYRSCLYQVGIPTHQPQHQP